MIDRIAADPRRTGVPLPAGDRHWGHAALDLNDRVGRRRVGQRTPRAGMQIRKVQLLKHPNGKSPNWYVRYWVERPDNRGWKEKWTSTRTTVKRDAEVERRRIERQLEKQQGRHVDLTWDEFVKEFLDHKAPRQRPTTYVAYRDCLKAFKKTAGPKLLSDVTLTMIESYGNQRLNADAAAETVNKDLRHLRAALRWAFRKKYISEVPPFKEAFIRVDRPKPTMIPEVDFVELVKSATGPRVKLISRSAEWWRVFLYLGYYLGVRRGEILGLTWDHVSFERLEVKVLAGVSKGRKERILPMSPVLGQILKAWKDGPSKPAHEVLPWPYNSFRQLYWDWHAIQKAAGIKDGEHYVPKNLRSACASALIAADIPTVVVKDFLGHASVTTTENYYINTKPALRSVASAREILVVDSDEERSYQAD